MEEIYDKYGLRDIMPDGEQIEDVVTRPGEMLDYGPEDWKDEEKRKVYVLCQMYVYLENAIKFRMRGWKKRIDRNMLKIIEKVVSEVI